jgi:predicted nucleotidyltransferase
MTSRTVDLRDRADAIARRFADIPAVEGICLFGSIARGNPGQWSDIDLLVVGSDPELSPTRLIKSLPENLKGERLSLLYYSPEELEELFESGASFIDHLRREGMALYDAHGVFRHILGDDFAVQLNVEEELDAELARLEVYRDLRMFKDNFLFVLTQLYVIGKSIVMLGLVAENGHEYNRDAAFEAFKRRHPELAEDVGKITRLRPFYRLVTRRGDEPLPFPYRGATRETEEAISAIKRIARVVKPSA